MSLRAIAQEVGIHFSTVSRELNRNATEDGYSPAIAHQMSETRKKTALTAHKRTAKMDNIIKEFLGLGWSPEPISQRLKIEVEGHEQLSYSTIYRRIEDDRLSGGQLYRKLPRFGKTRWKGGKRYRQAGVRLIPDRVDITNRPKIVDERA
jgi:IS30 family transposase